MQPFEPGFALTVAIAYRRVILSAIHGTAPTWVKIEHVLHEFSHLPGVTEDTLDIMMTLRKVAFMLHVNRPKILRCERGFLVLLQLPIRDQVPTTFVYILCPRVGPESLDAPPVWEDPPAHQATHVASDLIERAAHEGSETRSGAIPAGVSLRAVLRVASRGRSGQQSRKGPVSSIPAGARQFGERAACTVARVHIGNPG